MLKPLLSLYVTASSVQLSQSGCDVPCMNWSREFRKMLFFSFGTCLYVVYDVFGLITFINASRENALLFLYLWYLSAVLWMVEKFVWGDVGVCPF